jgi:hypothetical protein
VAHPAKVHAYIEGLAASAASMLVMAADHIVIASAGFVMIHNPWTWSVGDAAQLRGDADLLDKISGQLIDIYSKRSGQPEDTIREWLDAETWFTADEAVEAGMADFVAEAPQVLASIGRPDKFHNAPTSVAARMLTRAAAMAAINPPEKDMSDQTEPTTTDETTTEALDSPEPETAETPDKPGDEAKPEPAEDTTAQDRVAEGQRFIAAFGEDKGSRYFAKGLSFDAAQAAFVDDLKRENAELKASINNQSRGEDDPVQFQPAAGSDKTDESFNKLVNAFGGGADAEARARRVLDLRSKRSA